MSILTVKMRVMPERLLLLSRFYMRLDGVLFRIRDTRVFVEFGTKEVIREYTVRELPYAEVANVSKFQSLLQRQQLTGTETPLPPRGRAPRPYA